jgi:hypothetical protein
MPILAAWSFKQTKKPGAWIYRKTLDRPGVSPGAASRGPGALGPRAPGSKKARSDRSADSEGDFEIERGVRGGEGYGARFPAGCRDAPRGADCTEEG